MNLSAFLLLAVLTALLTAGCSNGAESEDAAFEATAREYLEEFLETNPEWATALGDHRFDSRLGDYSRQGIERSLALEKRYLKRLGGIDPANLGEVNAVDYEILRNRLESSIYQLEVIREHEWNPLLYNPGWAIYGLLARGFAPVEERLTSVMGRLQGLDAVLAAARENLQNPPRVHTETAILQNPGTIGLIRDELESLLDGLPGLKERMAPVREQAIAALEDYGKWLEEDLLPRSDGDFRLGEEKFRKKLAHTLHSDLSMEEILRRAEARLADTRQELYETALPLHEKFFPNASAADRRDTKKVIKATLDKLAETRPNDETIVDLARKTLDEATAFVRGKKLVTLPGEPLEIIVMPEFQRGVAVAYCDSPGPLESDGKTFYAIAPTPKDWSEERRESFYREYNLHMLYDLTVHEAMPGHYLQLAHSNRFKPPTLVRHVFYSGPFVEGWAVYTEQAMVEQGFIGPELKMQQLKMLTRAIINAIIDQKIHAGSMTEQEAMDLMMNEGFQEEGEAAGKWRRACLTSAQLSTYFVGSEEVKDLRKAYEAKHGPIADWRAYHDEVLSFGSPPAKFVRQAMGL